MGKSAPESVEVDRVHRVTSYAYQNKDRPKDLICKVHKCSVKEAFMKIAWDTPTIEYEGAQIFLFHDISSLTLMQHLTVRPLLEALRSVDVRYRWGVPFSFNSLLAKWRYSELRMS